MHEKLDLKAIRCKLGGFFVLGWIVFIDTIYKIDILFLYFKLSENIKI